MVMVCNAAAIEMIDRELKLDLARASRTPYTSNSS